MKKLYSGIILILGLFLCSISAQAEVSNFNISSNMNSVNINSHFSYYLDFTKNIDISNINFYKNMFILHNEASSLDLKYANGNAWLYITIFNRESKPMEWILEYRYPLIDYIDLYIRNNQDISVFHTGDMYRNTERQFPSRTFCFRVVSPPGESNILLKISGNGSKHVDLAAWDEKSLNKFLVIDHIFQGIYFGIMLSLFFYNLIIFIVVNHRSYLYLSLFIISITMLSAANSGFASLYFWGKNLTWNNYAHPFFVFMSNGTMLLFSSSFLMLHRSAPKINRLIIILSFLIFFLGAFSFFLPYKFITQFSVFATLFICAVLFAVTILSLKQQKRAAVFFLFSYVFLFAGIFFLALRAYGLMNDSLLSIWGMQTGSAIMILLLSIGVADKMKLFRIQRSRALHTVKEVENKFSNLVDNAHDGILIYQNKEIIYANNSFRDISGYTDDDLKNILLDDILPSDSHGPDPQIDHNRQSYQYYGHLINRDGSSIDAIISIAEAVNLGEKAKLIIITDISAIKKAEETIMRQYEEIESQYEEMTALNDELSHNHEEILEAHEKLARDKEQLATTLKSISEAVITIDLASHILLSNPEAERLSGLSSDQLAGKFFSQIFAFRFHGQKSIYPDIAQTILTEQKNVVSERYLNFLSKSGQEFIIELNGNPIFSKNNTLQGAVIIIRDVTEKYRLEQEIMHINKIESLAVLAGGIAHDFNNLLTAILGNLSIAKINLQRKNDCAIYIDRIEEATHKATGLTRQLLTFSKGGDPIKKTESVKEMLNTELSFMLTGSKVKGSASVQSDLWNVEVDIIQFSQVIQNLIINALQAMPDGGNISIAAENFTDLSDTALPRNFIKISISDTGCGISPENINRIFDPYFTTKSNGSGLGLASCYSIIKKHGGRIDVSSEMGSGSTFTIFLPATDKARSESVPLKNVFDFQGKHVLLVDDNIAVRDVTAQMLGYLNLKVSTCNSGEEAIILYQKLLQGGTPFDLIVTDIIIPGSMSGEKALKKILEIDPNAKAIAISGYADDQIMANFKLHGFMACLNKPYEATALARVISSVLLLDQK